MAWWTRHWEDIRPQLKYEFAKWLLTQLATGAIIGASVGLYHFLQTMTTDWHGFFFVFALSSLVLVVLRWPRRERLGSKPAEQSATVPALAAKPAEFLNVDEFYKTYDNAILVECENNIRQLSDKCRPGDDRDRFLIRLFASTLIAGLFEYLWLPIFRSQIKLLEALNKSPMKIEDAVEFYNAAINMDNAEFYKNYPFSAWLAFVKSWALVAEQGNTLAISIRGREFLKYLIQTGRSADDRVN